MSRDGIDSYHFDSSINDQLLGSHLFSVPLVANFLFRAFVIPLSILAADIDAMNSSTRFSCRVYRT